MKTEQAIKLLHRLQDEQFDGIHGDERREALNMAVKALVEPNLGQKTIDCIIKRLNDEDRTTGDTIYRQDVIDAYGDWYVEEGTAEGFIGTVKQLLEGFPSAQPTQSNADSTHENTLDCVSRQQAIDGIKKEILERDGRFYKGLLVANHVILHLPPAQPQRKKGKWINHRKDDGHNIADCDQCGNAIQWFDGDEIPRYCCMCGADMRGESE